MKRFSRYQNPTNFFVDMLTLVACAFGLLFVLAVMRMAVENSKKNVEVKAEFIVTVTWPDEIKDDIDTWVEDPAGNKCSFNRREAGLMALDRDDQGDLTDIITTQYGTKIEFKGNREVVTIRGVVPGEYVVNIHVYRKSSPEPCKVRVQLDKINPYGIAQQKEIEVYAKGEERTAFRFRVNGDGEVVEINNLPKPVAVRQDTSATNPFENNGDLNLIPVLPNPQPNFNPGE